MNAEDFDEKLIVTFTYTNHRGETAQRRIVPGDLYFGSTEFHPERQWLLKAFDMDKLTIRDFAMKDIKDWKQEK